MKRDSTALGSGHSMGGNMRQKMRYILDIMREEPPEATLRRYREEYPQITIAEALEAKALFFSMVDAPEKDRKAAITKYSKDLAGVGKRKA